MKTLRHIAAIFAVTLWLLPGYGMAAQTALPSTLAPALLNAPPVPGDDSLRARIKACLAMGDVACVVTQWTALKGTDNVPGWLTAFQRAFELTNRVKNYQVATNGYHVAVRLNGKIIDAYTGLAGLPEEEYLRRLVPYPGMQMLTEITESL